MLQIHVWWSICATVFLCVNVPKTAKGAQTIEETGKKKRFGVFSHCCLFHNDNQPPTLFRPFDFSTSGTQAHNNYKYAEILLIVYKRDSSARMHDSDLDKSTLPT